MSDIPYLVSHQKANISIEGLSNDEDGEDGEDKADGEDGEDNEEEKDEKKASPNKNCIPPPAVPAKYLMNIKKQKEFSNNYNTYLNCIKN